jgi:putative DNA methylase
MRGPRYAEEMFPVKEISEMSLKEKTIRHGHISTFHIWWARRPLTSSRAMNYAALVPMPKKIEEIKNRKEFIIQLSKWENSFNKTLIDKATQDILNENDDKAPKVLDPFAGGGSIPLELMRLGCETYASDYNPVAALILKCILEFPYLYRGDNHVTIEGLKVDNNRNDLLEDVRNWGSWVLQETKKELGKFYISDNDGYVPVGYIWSKIIPCQNPSCNAQIPLMRKYWLKTKGSEISLYPVVLKKEIRFKIVGGPYGPMPNNFDPNKGTVHRAIATCIVCGTVVDNKTTSRLFREGKASEKMIAVVLTKAGHIGKKYRISNEMDRQLLKKADTYLGRKRNSLLNEWGIDPVPDEPLPPKESHRAVGSQLPLYNFKCFGDLFNSRQKLCLVIFVEKVRQTYTRMLNEGYTEDYAKVITTFLSVILDRLVDKNSSLVVYDVGRQDIAHTFGRQTLQMVWDYIELNPFANVGWRNMQKWVELVLSHCLKTSSVNDKSQAVITATESSATEIQFPDNFFDAVITDPPYYDNVPYSYLSDFFYVWLKRSIGHLYPELFSTLLTPKSKEIVAYSRSPGGGKQFFESMLKKSLIEIHRVLKPNGITVIVYAHKSTEGWETLINSLLDSGLVVTAAWPINTEMKTRLNATQTAALASSIYMVAGKYEKKLIGFYRDIKSDLKKHLTIELDKLWNEGISGADFLVSAIGSAIEVFGMYKKIIDDEGNEIRANKLLEQIRTIVTDYAMRQVLHNGFASEISQMTRFYLLWRWAYGEGEILFDDARKLAQSVGLDLTHNWNKGFIQKDKESIRILGPSDRNAEDLTNSNELIDVLHRVLLLWNKGKGNEVLDVLQQSGLGKNDTFYRIAQAISESLPIESKEKKWLEGFLAGKARISKQIKVESGQRGLFE